MSRTSLELNIWNYDVKVDQSECETERKYSERIKTGWKLFE